MCQRGILGSTGKAASQLYTHNHPVTQSPSPSAASTSSSDTLPPAFRPMWPQALSTTHLVLLKALSLTQWCSSKWWPDTSLFHHHIWAWPFMNNKIGRAHV